MVRQGEGTLIDVRTPGEYSGELVAPPGLPETAQRCGHIPGAKNVPWGADCKKDGAFRSADEIRQRYADAGVTEEFPIVTYCRIGERSSHSWFVLKYLLGFQDVRNYDGSWTEYGNLVGVPIERSQRGESS
jgi:thiosulfate/3-mercaptopyruvate sulfurtransferase